MIVAHQPTIFGSRLRAGISSKANGNMKFGGTDNANTIKNREAFLSNIGIPIEYTTVVSVTYDTDDFAKYRIVTDDEKGKEMKQRGEVAHADALVTFSPNHALFLPLADCVGAIIYDEVHGALMVSHLGRHSVEIDGAKKSVEYLQNVASSDPASLKVWLSPGVGSATYPLNTFNGQSLHEVIIRQLQKAGVKQENIENADIDTAKDDAYYSHSEFLKGNDTDAGRFAIVAMMMGEQGEPAF
jgi:copper oxidase (laccase) domain-containing protein